MTKQVFREEDDQRLSVITVNLSSEGMEDVGRNGRVHELHVAILMLPCLLLGGRVVEGMVVTKLKESLDPGGRVLGSLSVVSVGKGHDETR